MRRSRWVLGVVVIAVVTGASLAWSPWAGGATALPFPNSMASAGDSVTRAFDVSGRHFLFDSPKDSWSTGSNTSVNSQYQRLLAANPAIAGHAYNDARTGARMADLDGEVKAAAGQGVEYLTVLMGANDLCAASGATMSPAATFRAEFSRALADFFAADPGAHVFVSSIPNLFQLWSELHRSSTAELAWQIGRICPSLLSWSSSTGDRQAVVARERADNASLAAVCGRYRRCHWDGYAVYNLRFTVKDISRSDHFHPNLAGQKMLAAATWAAGFWATAR